MKQMISNIGYKLIFFCILMTSGIYAQAEDLSDTLSSASYHVTMPRHLNPFYNGPLSYIIIGVVGATMIFLCYRYYVNNQEEEQLHSHTPHHQ